MCTRILLLTIILSSNIAIAQVDESYYKEFFEKLIGDKDLTEYVSGDCLRTSGRLGISYKNTPYKFLIGNDVEDVLKEKIISEDLNAELTIIRLSDTDNKVIFKLPSLKKTFTYYFSDSKLTFPTTLITQDWKVIISNYFIFRVSNTELTNQYAIDGLDKFAEDLCNDLKLTSDEIQYLKTNKIIYYLCKDEEQIQSLTGYRSKGMCILAEDAVASTYNSHKHEIAHLLINYKLKENDLYTLPFVQEGFAVACGGRGGLSNTVVTGAGSYLLRSGFINADSLLSKKGFQSEDPSITYAAAGYINEILIKEYGIEKYLGIYKQLSGKDQSVRELTNDKVSDILNLKEIGKEIESSDELHKDILFKADESFINSISTPLGEVTVSDNYYKFNTTGTYLLSETSPMQNYKSKLFKELFPERIYNGEKYYLILSPEKVKVYNFYSDELIASYDESFSLQKENNGPVMINKSIFDKNFQELVITFSQ